MVYSGKLAVMNGIPLNGFVKRNLRFPDKIIKSC